MYDNSISDKNPRRVAAGRLNRQKRGPLSEESRAKLSEAAHHSQPWRYSTGPKTADGKAQAVLNGKRRQVHPRSVRELRSDVEDVHSIIRAMRQCRASAEELM